MAVIVKTNVSQATDYLISDIGILIPNSGGSETFSDAEEITSLLMSRELLEKLTDNAFGASSSTLILNDGTSDIDQSFALNFLAVSLLASSNSPFGVVQTDSSGEVIQNVTFDGTATVSNFLAGTDVDLNNNKLTNVAAGTVGSDGINLDQATSLLQTQLNWKEVLISELQLDGTNGILQGTSFYLDGQPTTGDTLSISDGITTRTYGFGSGGDVVVTIGGDADATMTNLASAITGDGSSLWEASKLTALESINTGSGTSTAGEVVFIYRTSQSSASFVDRIYGTFTTPALAQYINYNGELDYRSSTNVQLPSADPTQKEFGFGRLQASLAPNDTHFCRNNDGQFTWDSDGDVWQDTGSGSIVAGGGLTKTLNVLAVGAGNGIIVNPDDIEIDFGEVGDIQSLGTSNAAGVLNESARADHVHTHGDRGADGAVSHHDAQQIDVTGSYTNIGSPTEVETALLNIDAHFDSAAKVGKWLQFGASLTVPNSGQRYLEGPGGVPTSAAGTGFFRSGEIRGLSIRVNVADATNDYNVDVLVNSIQVSTLLLAATNASAITTALTTSYAANDIISVRLRRTSGSGKSDFADISVLLEVVDS